MWHNPHKCLIEVNEGRHEQNRVRVQIANPNLIVKKQSLKKQMNRHPKAPLEKNPRIQQSHRLGDPGSFLLLAPSSRQAPGRAVAPSRRGHWETWWCSGTSSTPWPSSRPSSLRRSWLFSMQKTSNWIWWGWRQWRGWRQEAMRGRGREASAQPLGKVLRTHRWTLYNSGTTPSTSRFMGKCAVFAVAWRFGFQYLL